MATNITHIFTDLGGVLLSNGWDRASRQKAVEKFGLDAEEIQERHHLTFDTYEVGKIDLDNYLERTVFYKKRSFSPAEFKKFMFGCSTAYPEMITLLAELKKKYNLKIATVNNEGPELNAFRIKKFKLTELADFFISSSFVHFRKPDIDIFKLAINVAQADPRKVLYLDDRALFVQVAATLGIKGIVHQNIEDTSMRMEKLGLVL